MTASYPGRSGLLALFLFTLSSAAFSQTRDEAGEIAAPQSNAVSTSAPHVEIYNWLYGSSRRSWYEWGTVTASVNSSLAESGLRLRAMGAVGGYAIDIPGAEAEIATVSGYEQNDLLSSIGTVGKLEGMNGFGGLQLGYGLQFERGKLSGFVGVALVKDWATGANMATSFVRHAIDAGALDVARLGVLGSLEGEYYPTDDTMISGWAIYTPAYRWGYFEARAGVALPFRDMLPRSLAENAYIGPHVALSMTNGARQPMFGGHISGVKIGDLHFNYTLGYTRESVGSGVYSILETTLQF